MTNRRLRFVTVQPQRGGTYENHQPATHGLSSLVVVTQRYYKGLRFQYTDKLLAPAYVPVVERCTLNKRENSINSPSSRTKTGPT